MIHYPSIGTTIKSSTQEGISLAIKYWTGVKLAVSGRSNRLKFNSNYRVRVNQRLVFPLSTTDFPLSPFRCLPQCYVSVLPTGREGAESRNSLTFGRNTSCWFTLTPNYPVKSSMIETQVVDVNKLFHQHGQFGKIRHSADSDILGKSNLTFASLIWAPA
jgi:hypothetical protein